MNADARPFACAFITITTMFAVHQFLPVYWQTLGLVGVALIILASIPYCRKAIYQQGLDDGERRLRKRLYALASRRVPTHAESPEQRQGTDRLRASRERFY